MSLKYFQAQVGMEYANSVIHGESVSFFKNVKAYEAMVKCLIFTLINKDIITMSCLVVVLNRQMIAKTEERSTTYYKATYYHLFI